jgi:hypothetical protein
VRSEGGSVEIVAEFGVDGGMTGPMQVPFRTTTS